MIKKIMAYVSIIVFFLIPFQYFAVAAETSNSNVMVNISVRIKSNLWKKNENFSLATISCDGVKIPLDEKGNAVKQLSKEDLVVVSHPYYKTISKFVKEGTRSGTEYTLEFIFSDYKFTKADAGSIFCYNGGGGISLINERERGVFLNCASALSKEDSFFVSFDFDDITAQTSIAFMLMSETGDAYQFSYEKQADKMVVLSNRQVRSKRYGYGANRIVSAKYNIPDGNQKITLGIIYIDKTFSFYWKKNNAYGIEKYDEDRTDLIFSDNISIAILTTKYCSFNANSYKQTSTELISIYNIAYDTDKNKIFTLLGSFE